MPRELTSYKMLLLFMIVLGKASQGVYSQKVNLTVEDKDLLLIVGESKCFHMSIVGSSEVSIEVKAVSLTPGVIKVVPDKLSIASGTKSAEYEFNVTALSVGYSDVLLVPTPAGTVNAQSAFLRIGVMKSSYMYAVTVVFGWLFFLSWSISFYPQIFENYRRKSVVGFCFDFLAYNLLGFSTLLLFNSALCCSSYVQAQYFERYPRGHHPVPLSDMFMSLFCLIATAVNTWQATAYERADQRVSTTARVLLALMILILVVSSILLLLDVWQWLDFLYSCSYVKLAITFIKYIPQAYMNYQRKSTEGWSIGTIITDFVGGILSMAEMILNAINFNDWISFLSLITKFGVGLFSLGFDFFFMVQHYILYWPKET